MKGMNGSMTQDATNLIWIDLEMTGLDPDRDSIIEIATIVTDAELEVLAEGPVFAIRHELTLLEAMDDWNTRHHSESGLWQRVVDSTISMRAAELQTLDFLKKWTEQGTSPMCGNSVCQDRRFLYRLMPELQAWFHYRNLDVSTLKELAKRWAPEMLEGFIKENRHEALHDIRDSIAELRHYRPFLGSLAACKNLQ